jgi:acyl-CoA thioesterase I
MLVAAVAACSSASKSGNPADSRDPTNPAKSNVAATAPSAPTVAPARAAIGGRRVVLFVGTSLTAGLGLDPDSAYPMLIQRKIDSAGLSFDVVNAGVSGETTSGLLDRLDWLTRARFDVLVLETGANDGLRGIPPSTVRANVETAVDRLRAKRPDARIVLVQMEAPPNLGPKYTSGFHALYGAVAREKGIPLLPFLLTDVAGHRELNQGDGIHPNIVGERIVANTVWKALEPILVAARKP